MTIDNEIKPEAEFGIISLQEGRYAVFTLNGCYSGLAAMYNTIYRQWLPSANVELRDAMSFEKYLNSPGDVKVDDLLTEIYIPIK